MSEIKLLTVTQAAEALNVSVRTVRNLIASGTLAHHRIGTGRGVIRISVEALQAHLNDCEVVNSKHQQLFETKENGAG